VVFKRVKAPFGGDPWHLKENQKLFQELGDKKRESQLERDDYLKIFSKSKNYIGSFNFDKLPAHVKEEYDSLKKPFELGEFQKQSEGNDKTKLIIGKLCGELLRKGYTQRKLAEVSEMALGTVNNYLKLAGVDALALRKEARRVDKIGGNLDLPLNFNDEEITEAVASGQ